MPSRSKTTAATQLMTRLGADSKSIKLKRELDRIATQAKTLLHTTTTMDALLRSVSTEHPHYTEINRLANIYLRDIKAHVADLNVLDAKLAHVQSLNDPDDWHLQGIALSEDYMSWSASLQNVVLPIAEQITQLVTPGVKE